MTGEQLVISTGETILFWVCAPIMVLLALGVAFSKKAIHALIYMMGLMLVLAVVYIMQDAPFLGTAHIVVYTGAILMVFLFVVMLAGVSAQDPPRKLPLSYRLISVAMIAALAGTLGYAVWGMRKVAGVGMNAANGASNPVAVAKIIFTQNNFSIILVGILLIAAAIGALTLSHTDRIGVKMTQKETAERKMRRYAAEGRHVGQLPAPGVYARSNAVHVPAISGETGEAVKESVPRVIRVQGLERSVSEVSPEAVSALKQQRFGEPQKGLHGSAASQAVGQSKAWGMPGGAPQRGLVQPTQEVGEVTAKEDETK